MSISRTARPVLLACALASLGMACAAAPATGQADHSRTVAAGQTFAMSPGDSVGLPDRGTLRYVALKSDSRCRPDVRCVWAGDAEVTFEWTASGGDAQTFGLHTGKGDRSRNLASRKVTLVALARGERPEAQLRLDDTQ